jgi:GT2 family glycosyltransferase
MGERSARFEDGARHQSRSTLPVSVVIPTFNRARLLERALRSVNAQRPRKPAQVLVVDDASTDDTPRVAEAFGARLIRHECNRGAAAAYQAGLRAADHEWVALLDDDDEWLPHHLDTLWALTSLSPESVLVADSCIECSADSAQHRFHGPLTEEPTILASPASVIYPENPVPSSAAMFRRTSALAVGGFRDVFCEDLDLWCRLLGRGSATLSPRVGMLYHAHPGQISENWEAMHAATLEIARSLAGSRRALVQRRAGVTAWDRFRVGRRRRAVGPGRRFLRELLAHPMRVIGVLGIWRYRTWVRRRTSRFTSSGEPSVAFLGGADPAISPERRRYQVDLSATSSISAFLRLARRPSAMAVVSSRKQAALVRLTGTRPVRVSDYSPARPVSSLNEARATAAAPG